MTIGKVECCTVSDHPCQHSCHTLRSRVPVVKVLPWDVAGNFLCDSWSALLALGLKLLTRNCALLRDFRRAAYGTLFRLVLPGLWLLYTE